MFLAGHGMLMASNKSKRRNAIYCHVINRLSSEILVQYKYMLNLIATLLHIVPLFFEFAKHMLSEQCIEKDFTVYIWCLQTLLLKIRVSVYILGYL